MEEKTTAYVDCVRNRREAAKMLGISIKTLTRIEHRGELPRVQITDRIVGYRDSALRRFISERERV
jgi:predicted DNA-binding transcriptional regulator AlpA